MRWRKTQHVEGLERGERMLAGASGPTGKVVATNRRLLLPDVAIEWDRVERASWDGDEETLYVTEITPAGQSRGHRVAITDPGRLVDVVRELVTASVVIIRRVPIDGLKGVRVTGRRQLTGGLTWTAAIDADINLGDPEMKKKVDEAVEAVRAEVESIGL